MTSFAAKFVINYTKLKLLRNISVFTDENLRTKFQIWLKYMRKIIRNIKKKAAQGNGSTKKFEASI